MTSIGEFDYELPGDRIAQTPLADRAAARLLVDRGSHAPVDRQVSDLPSLLREGDVLVVNTTRVLPARIAARRPTGGSAEVLLLRPTRPEQVGAPESEWEVLVRPSARIPPGTRLDPVGGPDADLQITIEDDLGDGRRLARVTSTDLPAALDRIGTMPLPPYITSELDDPNRYQTVYADHPASAAAPTAGLHFTPELLDEIAAHGVRVASIDLQVGLDTFRPVTVDDLDDHTMHSERYTVPGEAADTIERADRVVAVGTTTARALESFARFGNRHETDLFIRTPFEFRVVDLLLTNFHMPRSTLLVMVDAFVGRRWRTLYDAALARRYRFLSFGDAMLLDRHAR